MRVVAFGSKFDQSKFRFKGCSRIVGEGFHVEVSFGAGWRVAFEEVILESLNHRMVVPVLQSAENFLWEGLGLPDPAHDPAASL